MASIKKKSSGGGGANWMDTYGDMVTLLLCFFVLLYSMSSIDTQKWEWIVQQFNKDYNPGQFLALTIRQGGTICLLPRWRRHWMNCMII